MLKSDSYFAWSKTLAPDLKRNCKSINKKLDVKT